ncbi:REP-associated tyrosine transposase [Sulfitobacter geojensis]|uniref:REP-associated tyrosine transposase n=1 Tax=Sulfitobacter geojensis TaxID=1342299 RepID=UPI0004687C7D|nr:putative transposase [Sulfitobacter geojensis]
MPHYIRPRVTGATIFFTVCLQDRRSALLTEQIGLLRDAVRATKAGRPFEIVSMVVLPDHLHCVWRLPAGDRDFGRRWGAIKGRFSASVRRAGLVPPVASCLSNGEVNPALRKGQVGIWQKRFWEHHIRCEEDLANHVRYCHVNPVKHGFVARPEDWPWSSVHRESRFAQYDRQYVA